MPLSAPENYCLHTHKTIYLECLVFNTNTMHIFETTEGNLHNIYQKKRKKEILSNITGYGTSYCPQLLKNSPLDTYKVEFNFLF